MTQGEPQMLQMEPLLRVDKLSQLHYEPPLFLGEPTLLQVEPHGRDGELPRCNREPLFCHDEPPRLSTAL
jgi:hypothetical protein